MPSYETKRVVSHTPEQMFALVADVERYPEFLPMCEALSVRSRRERDGVTLLVADMTVGYKAIRETFTSQVVLKPAENRIDVKYEKNLFRSRKKGRPIAPDNGKLLNKRRVTGIPALIIDNVKLIKDLEDEPAYIRRERMLNVKENKDSQEPQETE